MEGWRQITTGVFRAVFRAGPSRTWPVCEPLPAKVSRTLHAPTCPNRSIV